jgi:putative addiction module component (TIGR02574 family)
MNAEQVTVEALNLSVQDRVSLAQALWQSLTPQAPQANVDELVETALRRGRELDNGTTQGISREDAMREAREALK